MTLVVLAAGMGSRYGGLKQMDPITPHGEFIIDFSVYDALRAGYDHVIFVIKRENYGAFRETVGARIESLVKVDYAFQEMTLPAGIEVPENRKKPFGTAHALLACKGLLKGDAAVINADDYYGVEPYRIAKEYMSEAKDEIGGKEHYCMVGYRLGNTLTENGTVSRGICEEDSEGNLTAITERTKIRPAGENAEYLDGDDWVSISSDAIASMNFFAFRDSFLDYVEAGMLRFASSSDTNLEKDEYFLPAAVSDSVKEGKSTLKVLKTNEKWFGVTYKEDKEKVVSSIGALVEKGVYPEGLFRK